MVIENQVRKLLDEGYQGITEQDMYEFLEKFYWKIEQPKTIQAMEISISKISANDYFDFQQLKAVTKSDFAELNYLL